MHTDKYKTIRGEKLLTINRVKRNCHWCVVGAAAVAIAVAWIMCDDHPDWAFMLSVGVVSVAAGYFLFRRIAGLLELDYTDEHLAFEDTEPTDEFKHPRLGWVTLTSLAAQDAVADGWPVRRKT